MCEGLLDSQQEFQYNEISYHIPTSYQRAKSKNFEEFLYRNPHTVNILGGWKFHISLDPGENNNNIARAWADIIIPALVSCEIREFKITKIDKIDMTAQGQVGQGKLITVYLRHNPELGFNGREHAKLVDMFNRIESGLIRYGIQPGPRPTIDHILGSSQYMSFRCDTLLPKEGSQASAEDIVFALEDVNAPTIAAERGTLAYNPFNMQDEYDLCNIKIDSQLIYNNRSI